MIFSKMEGLSLPQPLIRLVIYFSASDEFSVNHDIGSTKYGDHENCLLFFRKAKNLSSLLQIVKRIPTDIEFRSVNGDERSSRQTAESERDGMRFPVAHGGPFVSLHFGSSFQLLMETSI